MAEDKGRRLAVRVRLPASANLAGSSQKELSLFSLPCPDGWKISSMEGIGTGSSVELYMESNSFDGSLADSLLDTRLQTLDAWLKDLGCLDIEIFDPDALEYGGELDFWWQRLGVRIIRDKDQGDATFHPPFPPNGDMPYEIRLPFPHGAFGSGSHPSTISAARSLDFLKKEGHLARRHVMDVGTGTGILAILAALFGAKRVTALDIDPRAIERAQKNAEASRVSSKVELYCGSLERLNLACPDVIVANLTPSVMLDLFDNMLRLLSPEGIVALAGFQAGSFPFERLMALAGERGLVLMKSMDTEGWPGLVFQYRGQERR